jgi:hypothetical protein
LNEGNAAFFKAGDVDALAVAVNGVICDSGTVAARARQAVVDVSPYSWSKRAERLSEFVAQSVDE